MADVKISELTALTAPDGAEELVVNDGGTTKKLKIDNLFNQGIDVTGNFKVSGALPRFVLHETDTTDKNTAMRNNGGVFKIQTVNDANDSFTNRVWVNHTTGYMGIGNAAPATQLDVSSGDAGGNAALNAPIIRLTNTTGSSDWDVGDVNGGVEFYTADTSGNAPYTTAFIKSDNEQASAALPAGSLIFGTAAYNVAGGAVERMRITRDGDVGIGTAEPDSALHIRNITAKLILDDSNNGTGGTSYTPAIELLANGTKVGSFGMTDNSNLRIKAENINSASIGLWTGGSERVTIDSSGHAIIGGGITLGNGQAYAAVNTLDDYEEGTFTPVIRDSTSASGGNAATATYSYGQFTKIGNLVTITIMFQNINRQSTTASANIQIHGLPFASQSVSGSVFQQGTVGGSFLSFEADGAYLTSETQDGHTYMRIAENRSGLGRDFLTFSQLASDSSSDMYISIHYKTNQ